MATSSNNELLQKLSKKEISPEAVMAGWMEEPKRIEYPSESWCYHFKRKWGWSLLSAGSSSQQSLPYSHPDMESVRQYVNGLRAEGVHGALILNFDQVWRAAFRSEGRLLYKHRGKVGQRGGKRKAPQHLNKKLGYIKGSRRSLTVPSLNFRQLTFREKLPCLLKVLLHQWYMFQNQSCKQTSATRSNFPSIPS